jgi:carbonic anhydrase/acetyltransferase-like protein (isoleucine patch superfamily)
VRIHEYSTVWYNCVVRGDINRVEILPFTSIGDGTVIHTAAALPTGMSARVYIGRNVTVGRGCTLYSCHIEEDVMIGDKCVILEGARIEKGAQLAPGTVVPPGRLIPAKQLWAGNPASWVKDLNVGETWHNYTKSYVETAMGDAYKNEFTVWNSAYLERESTADDVEPNENEAMSAYTHKNYFKGIVKYYC